MFVWMEYSPTIKRMKYIQSGWISKTVEEAKHKSSHNVWLHLYDILGKAKFLWQNTDQC